MKMNKYQEALNKIRNIVLDESGDGYYTQRYLQDFYSNACETLQELVYKAESFEWIPFEMEDGFLYCQIPDDGEDILVTDGKVVWHDTWIECDEGYVLDSGYELYKCLAWMPLPKPYKEKENE